MTKWTVAAMFAAAAAPVAAAPAAAAHVQPAKQAHGKTLILVPLVLTKLDDLSFGTIVPAATSGTVTINPKTGARSVTGAIAGVASDVGKRAYFGGAGSAGHQVVIDISPPAELVSTTNPSDTLPVLAITLDGSVIRTIDSTRTFFFGIGGTIQINANQPEGFYQAYIDVNTLYL